MTDAERIDTVVTVALQAMELAEVQVRKNYAVTLIAIQFGVSDVDAAVQEILARPDVARKVEEMTFSQRSQREVADAVIESEARRNSSSIAESELITASLSICVSMPRL